MQHSLARILAEKLSQSLGQSFVVEEEPGGGSIVGTDTVAKSPPDGYTLLKWARIVTVSGARADR
jgi:tripartite-type tricarboxylate transporter receptor subunit TctC